MTFLQAQCCCQEADAPKGAALLREATALRRQALGAVPDKNTELKQRDFDQLITFFSRQFLFLFFPPRTLIHIYFVSYVTKPGQRNHLAAPERAPPP